jgi:hypothetical protein
MNKLDVDYTNVHGLSFILLIDGTPAWEVMADQNSAIPYHEVLTQLPDFAVGATLNDRYVSLTCCDCGVLGCGSTSFRIQESDGLVHLVDCSGNGKRLGFLGEFLFTAQNFYDVVTKIYTLSRTFETLSKS